MLDYVVQLRVFKQKMIGDDLSIPRGNLAMMRFSTWR